MNYIKDDYGGYILESEVEENGKIYQWRKYINSKYIKSLGGMYANAYVNADYNTVCIKFYRNDYIRTKAYPKFIRETENK